MAVNYEKGMIVGGSAAVTFQWNPFQVRIPKRARWNKLRAAGREQPVLQYGCGDAIPFVLFIQLSADGDINRVKQQTDALLALTKCTSKGAGVDCPPVCRLRLGNALKIKCVVESVDTDWKELFDPRGILPQFGWVRLVLTEYNNA